MYRLYDQMHSAFQSPKTIEIFEANQIKDVELAVFRGERFETWVPSPGPSLLLPLLSSRYLVTSSGCCRACFRA